MKVGLTIAAVTVALTVGFAWYRNSIPDTDDCTMPSSPHVVRQEANVLLQYWLMEDRPQLYQSTLPRSSSLLRFRDRIKELIDVEPYPLLERQLSYVSGGDAENVTLVLSGSVPIRTISCLEGLLLATQAERSEGQGRSMFTHPTEFSSYVLQRGDSLKIWYYTVDQPGIRGLATLHESWRISCTVGSR